jgi:hypothetical protein
MKSGEAADSGFSGPATSTTYVIDFNKPTPAWRKTANMAYPRSFENLTALPDGTVLVTGGDTTKNGTNAATAVEAAELWNPITETWSTMASEQRPRLYHSIAILMPDGRVFVSGGGNDSPPMPNELTAEYYSPPYLFKGARPIVSSAPGTVQYGSQFFVATPDASTIASVALIKASAVTHFTNMEQRFMNLSFTQASGGITVNAPASPNVATPGVYMLFIVNNNGVPAVAPFVTLPSSFDNAQPPSITSALTASGTAGSPFSYTITASNNPTSFNATNLPTWASVNTTTGVISGTPTVAGTSSVTLSATNAGGTGSATLALTITQPSTVLLGDQVIESQLDDNVLGSAEAFQSAASASGTVGSLKIYLDGSSTATKLVAGLYADNAGHPGALIAQGSSTALTPAAWNSVTIIPGAIVTAGQPYWIAILGTNSGLLRFRDRNGGCNSETNAQSNLTSLPSSWATGSIYPSCPLSGYGIP